ncbi:hypothetical protein Rsub_11603 [Raphidocelis subcapitata]|uniref:F-box domain-containing protein n=1 Tax=Raphidocelis subcapitata TaxID=307507 RepID=A0A2V0PG59_9CHLO|nr:hypothetical protein Rsub_11603 [Raphidocelis subcapitata]|eukprot:GBF98838.1 hypothetical protein Rsub_11603 [Raphidocelis subcapitata]
MATQAGVPPGAPAAPRPASPAPHPPPLQSPRGGDAPAACGLAQLPHDVMARIVAACAPQDRAALAAACAALAGAVRAHARRLRLRGGGGACAARAAAARAGLWGGVGELVLCGEPGEGAASALIDAAASHWPHLSHLDLRLPPGPTAAALAAAAGALARGAGLRRLASLSLGGAAPLRLGALAGLTGLTELELSAPVDAPAAGAAARWLPPSLRRLALAGGVGGAWLRGGGAAGCDRLEALELRGLGPADFGADDPALLHATLAQLTALTSLRGLLRSTAPEAPPPQLLAALLLPALPRLRVCSVYALWEEDPPRGGGGLGPGAGAAAGELAPALAGSWREVSEAPAAAVLEELAITCHPDPRDAAPRAAGAGGQGAGPGVGRARPPPLPPLPALSRLHATAHEPGAWPEDPARTWPALSEAAFGDACPDASVHLPPLPALARCPALRALSLAAGEWGAAAAAPPPPGGAARFGFEALSAAAALTRLTLHDLAASPPSGDVLDPPDRVTSRELLAALAAPPALARLELCSSMGDPWRSVADPEEGAFAAAAAAAAGGPAVAARALVARGCARPPCLLAEGDGWWGDGAPAGGALE